ncbi:transcriptional regulator GcvA [Verticiella sediminum]|uniref:Transcriptional regulator GcvA n=1 Tax=Verticiella sediminum TaxID=1247510 RepID=A0A556AFU6_9BURK|nr:transcriptional regulator GcvA [Verticiella sediminum]TSH91761.1 transcriptional regulator GcvA [Verticiella sediminum]
MHKLPPLAAIRAFEAAGRLSSFSRAADELCVTHGAVSHQIRLLESWLGIVLFVRRSKSVTLTDQGRHYLDSVSPALSAIAAASRQLSAHEVLRVNALPTITMRWLFPRLARFRSLYPNIEVKISTGLEPTHQLPADVDVVIRREPDRSPGWYKVRMLSEAAFPVCSPTLLEEFPLAAITDLRHHTFLHCPARPTAWKDWLAMAHHSRVIPAQSLELEHLYFCLQAAIDGIGIAMGYTPLVATDLAAGRLVAPFGGVVASTPGYFLIAKEERRHDPIVKAFLDWLLEEGRQFDDRMRSLPALPEG